MKAGTTTLYRDLLTHPGVYFPIDKEPEHLVDDAVLGAAGREAYAKLFEGASPDQICGEASTAYTKRPTFEGVPERAATLLGPGLRVIYLMREPAARTLSQHRHELASGELNEPDIERAIESHPRLIEYSRYAMQIEPWIETLGEASVLALGMEAYTSDRAATVARVQAFLGLEPKPELVEADKVYNQSAGKPVMTGGWRSVQQSSIYQKTLRPLLSLEMRAKLRRALLPKDRGGGSDPKSRNAADQVEARIRKRLREDTQRLGSMLGDDAPAWAKAAAG